MIVSDGGQAVNDDPPDMVASEDSNDQPLETSVEELKKRYTPPDENDNTMAPIQAMKEHLNALKGRINDELGYKGWDRDRVSVSPTRSQTASTACVTLVTTRKHSSKLMIAT